MKSHRDTARQGRQSMVACSMSGMYLSPAVRAAAWLASQREATDIDDDERFEPKGAPPGLTPSGHPIWKIPGARPFARPIRLTKGWFRERRSRSLTSAMGPTGLIFVHVPKNAGSSVTECLYGGTLGHHSMQFLRGALPRQLSERAFSFAILRDPYARFRSAFAYLKTMPTFAADIRFRDNHLADIADFETFVARLEDPSFRRVVTKWHHFREQCAFVSDSHGRLLVDALFSMERMDTVQAMLHACLPQERIIGRSNASSLGKPECAGAEIVAELFAEDMRLYERLSSSPIQVLRTPKFRNRLRPER
ncbi:sulfotransferase family 2 domain-containing protein [Paracoccus sp. MBLB3053]|uniref:Sulfotransferase family 2 domain-containing protein n=1 Tax=Paracoccus aurantius TaxID=3073814 RepID=A0ABU2HV52_9RHOB|nr:sulfotransferase family 2 domain-containing protein [Paracoccus sp. MBLB3053]MDS9468922.1 sulfotransferase family 2 domain-containing protein [Paracoccus sp. MBLB3053]